MEIDPEKWAKIKSLAAMDRKTIRQWLDEVIARAIERKRK